MAYLESILLGFSLAAIVFFECLKDGNPLKKEFDVKYVCDCLQAARDYYVSVDKSYLEK